MARVGVFGGSFNPIHHGHLLLADEVRELLGLDRVLFVPAGAPPHKSAAGLAPAADRHAMVRLAVADHPGLAVSDVELRRPGPSYTVDTLRALLAREPGIRLTLLLGADAAAEIDAWHQAEAIPSLATVVVFARAGVPVPSSRLIARTIEVPGIAISATEIRRRVREGRHIRYWVPDPVAEYVTRHRLYLDPA